MRSLDQIRRKTRGHPIMFGSSNAAIDTSFSPGCIFAVVFVVVYQSDTRLRCTIEFIALRICSFCIRYIIEQETRGLLQRGQQNKILKSRRRTVPECPVERAIIGFFFTACRYITRRRTIRLVELFFYYLFGESHTHLGESQRHESTISAKLISKSC